jgi:hypothetical protein
MIKETKPQPPHIGHLPLRLVRSRPGVCQTDEPEDGERLRWACPPTFITE